MTQPRTERCNSAVEMMRIRAVRVAQRDIDQVCTQPADTPAHPDGSTDRQGNATTPPIGETATVLYRDAHEQVRTAWAFLPEFHQIFNGLHLVGPRTRDGTLTTTTTLPSATAGGSRCGSLRAEHGPAP